MSKLSTIEGIGPAIEARLKAAGIRSVAALLKAGGTSSGRKEISENAEIAEGQLLKFVNHADLMRVNGVGGEYAELLEAAGVDSVPELAQRNPENLAKQMAQVNAARSLVRAVPTAARVVKWVREAKTMGRAVFH